MDLVLKSLILDPEKKTISVIKLNDTQIGYFLLGKKQILFLGKNLPDTDDDYPCITLNITGDDKTAKLEYFFYTKDKIDCTELPGSIFFELFDVVLPAIGITELKLTDVSYKLLNLCEWELLFIGFFTTGYTYYERYGFKNGQHDTLEGKNKITELRSSVKLNDLYPDHKKLKELYDKFKSIYTDGVLKLHDEYFDADNFEQFKNMLLKDFLLKYVKPFCELDKTYEKKIHENTPYFGFFVQGFLTDIASFLEKKGFGNDKFIKIYPPVKPNSNIVITQNIENNKILDIHITTLPPSGGRKSKKKTKRKAKKKAKRKTKNYKKKNFYF